MSKVAHIVWTTIGISITAVLLIGAAVWGYVMRPTEDPCVSLAYSIEDRSERMYLTESELTQALRNEDIYPVGRTFNRVSLHRIENAIRRHPMVRTAECYATPRNEVKVRLSQRVPLLRVQILGGTYLIDTDRRVMQARAAVKDSVPVVTGAVGVQMASGSLADFALWLQDNPYWSARIHHIYVQSPQMVYIYLRGVNQPRVVLGSMREYERKLNKLQTFLEKGADAIQNKQYTELDIRFRGQVIGRY